jgi:hypothetical protein
MVKLLVIVPLIVLGIVLQNTCPFGLAGKTALASPIVHHCPLKDHHKPCNSGPGARDLQDMQKNFKPFTLMGFTVESGDEPELLAERAEAALADRYEEVIVPLPIKPPKSGPVPYC